MLEEGIIPAFYSDKIKDEYSTRPPTVLSMSILLKYFINYALSVYIYKFVFN